MWKRLPLHCFLPLLVSSSKRWAGRRIRWKGKWWVWGYAWCMCETDKFWDVSGLAYILHSNGDGLRGNVSNLLIRQEDDIHRRWRTICKNFPRPISPILWSSLPLSPILFEKEAFGSATELRSNCCFWRQYVAEMYDEIRELLLLLWVRNPHKTLGIAPHYLSRNDTRGFAGMAFTVWAH